MNKKSIGFTIVELLIVIVVMGILATIAVVVYSGVQVRAHATATASNVGVYEKALAMLRVEDGGYPSMSACLGGVPVEGGDSTCGEFRYAGPGCGADDGTLWTSSTYSSATQTAFNNEIKRHLSVIPAAVSMKEVKAPLMTVETEGGQCAIIATMTGATYSAATYITVRQDGSISYTYVGGNPLRGAYMISYLLPGNVECYLPTAIKRYEPSYNSTQCSVFGGEIIYE